MRRIKTSTGVTVLLNGDLLAIMDVLYQEVTARHELERSFDEMNNEIGNLIDQMTAPELRKYLQEALFVNTITYENQRAAAYIKRVGGRPRKKVNMWVATHRLTVFEDARRSISDAASTNGPSWSSVPLSVPEASIGRPASSRRGRPR